MRKIGGATIQMIAYNAAILGGVALIGIGAGMQFGLPTGLMTTGVCMLVLTMLMIRGSRKA